MGDSETCVMGELDMAMVERIRREGYGGYGGGILDSWE